MDLAEKIFNAGVVGAGGAGFPAHVKAKAEVEFMIANGAECEPLLHKDFELMVHYAEEIVTGMNLMIENTKAKKGFFGIKSKNTLAISAVEKVFLNGRIELCQLGDFYPSGDEYELVYEATKRLIPPHGIPLDVGAVVNNVETLYNISNAAKDIPVTEKFVCITGKVKTPSTFFAPIGTTYGELLEHCGGTAISDYGIFVGGVMMGRLTFDLNEVVTKTTTGLIILPKDHYLIKRMNRTIDSMNRIGRSACDQCSYCTEFCPRYLLGYDVQPHKVMRSLEFSQTGEAVWNQYADLCCLCGLCSLYACPEDLYPREACDQSKSELKNKGITYNQVKPVKVHPIKEGRRVPLKQLMKKLDLTKFNVATPFNNNSPNPDNVKIMLKQHVGVPAAPVVDVGDVVKKGSLIGKVDPANLGANIHSSISGKVTEINSEYILIE
ncbi:electron transport complex protein RnfC [bacterium BMS3Abin04]|nr:electron transport complex protein RnfC [bacterium BMS3Abin04]